MSTENLECLLEKIVLINENMLGVLGEIKNDMSDIKQELNWVGENTYAKVVYDGLNEITDKLSLVELGVSNIDSNTSDL
ncbi:MAG: hypothetical protein L3J59_02375 [Methylococcaceae bacterium]|nr:hypothetical protein [Methylococcaceae bacterium]